MYCTFTSILSLWSSDNSPINDLNVNHSWIGFFDHISNEVVFIPGAFRLIGRSASGWWQDELKTPLRQRGSSVSHFVFVFVQKRQAAKSQTRRHRPDQMTASVSATSSVPRRSSPVQARVSLCSAGITNHSRWHSTECPFCQRAQSSAPTLCPQCWEKTPIDRSCCHVTSAQPLRVRKLKQPNRTIKQNILSLSVCGVCNSSHRRPTKTSREYY